MEWASLASERSWCQPPSNSSHLHDSVHLHGIFCIDKPVGYKLWMTGFHSLFSPSGGDLGSLTIVSSKQWWLTVPLEFPPDAWVSLQFAISHLLPQSPKMKSPNWKAWQLRRMSLSVLSVSLSQTGSKGSTTLLPPHTGFRHGSMKVGLTGKISWQTSWHTQYYPALWELRFSHRAKKFSCLSLLLV